MPEHVRRDVLLDARAADRRREDVARNAVDGAAVPQVVDEESTRVARCGNTARLHVTLREFRGEAADRHDAVLLPFALADEQRAASEVDVREVEADQLTEIHAFSTQDVLSYIDPVLGRPHAVMHVCS
ncbi:MAG TPA: hypothetical protein VGQ76_20095 [Thermoanaerobaculia bacterium]|nr:hypothetical protein [Thermoanaerobaculia bacterium]